MSSRTEEKYTYYLSSLRDIVRHLPKDLGKETKNLISQDPYCGPEAILSVVDTELATTFIGTRKRDVLQSVRNFATLLKTVQPQAVEAA